MVILLEKVKKLECGRENNGVELEVIGVEVVVLLFKILAKGKMLRKIGQFAFSRTICCIYTTACSSRFSAYNALRIGRQSNFWLCGNERCQ